MHKFLVSANFDSLDVGMFLLLIGFVYASRAIIIMIKMNRRENNSKK